MNLDSLLTDTAPTSDPDAAVLAAGRRRLDDRVRRAQSVVLEHRRRARRRRVGLSLVGAAATTALVVTLVPWSPWGATPEARAAEVLVVASEAAAAQRDTVGDARYWHTVTTYVQEGLGADGAEHRRESWNARVEPGLLVDEGVDASDPIGMGAARFQVGATSLDWAGLDALPTDPVALRDLLYTDLPENSRSEDDLAFDQITALLVESPASPALRAALWKIASQIDGVRLVGEVTDAAGRTGTALEMTIRYDHGTEVRRLVVDPETGTLLERVDSYDGPGTETDTRYRATYLEQGPADTLPVQPQLLPGCTSWDRC
jgi:hypothetical protein